MTDHYENITEGNLTGDLYTRLAAALRVESIDTLCASASGMHVWHPQLRALDLVELQLEVSAEGRFAIATPRCTARGRLVHRVIEHARQIVQELDQPRARALLHAVKQGWFDDDDPARTGLPAWAWYTNNAGTAGPSALAFLLYKLPQLHAIALTPEERRGLFDIVERGSCLIDQLPPFTLARSGERPVGEAWDHERYWAKLTDLGLHVYAIERDAIEKDRVDV